MMDYSPHAWARCHRWIAFGAAVSCSLFASTIAHAACDVVCKLPEPVPSTTSVVVDVTTQKLSGATDFPESTRIEVVLKNKNPFRFEYSLGVNTALVDRGILRDAFAALGFPDFEKLLANADTDQPQKTSEQSKAALAVERTGASHGPKDPCIDLLAKYEGEIDSAYDKRETLLAAAKVDATKLSSAKKSYLEFDAAVKAADISTIACSGLCEKASSAVSALKIMQGPTELSQKVAQLSAIQSTVKAIPTKAKEALTAQQLTQCSVRMKLLSNQSSDFVAQIGIEIDAYSQTLKELSEKNKDYQAVIQSVEGILASRNSFISSEYISENEGAVVHSLVLTIKDRLNPNAAAQVFPLGDLRAGRPTFSFSVGPALSFINHRKYGRQAGLVPDGSGGTSVGSVIAITEESGENIGIVGQINARLFDLAALNGAVHLSFGASIGDGEANDVGIFLGPSLSLRKNAIFVTLAYHYQETQKLGQTFVVGQQVPDELKGEIPTNSKRIGGLLFTLTLKVR